MTTIRVVPIATDIVRAYQAGAPDANGLPPERAVSDGDGAPCRHCLSEIPKDAPMLVLAHRPFPAPQPYAEIGPIFLCAAPCAPWFGDGSPQMFLDWDRLLIRGYGPDDRIVYGTGAIVATQDINHCAEALFSRPDIAYLHLRSAANNCFQARIERRTLDDAAPETFGARS